MGTTLFQWVNCIHVCNELYLRRILFPDTNSTLLPYDEAYGSSGSGLYATNITCNESRQFEEACNFSTVSNCSGTPVVAMCEAGKIYTHFSYIAQ